VIEGAENTQNAAPQRKSLKNLMIFSFIKNNPHFISQEEAQK